MMRFIVFVLILTGGIARSQELPYNGFYGKKAFVEIDGSGYFPMIQNLFGDGFYKRKGDQLKYQSRAYLGGGFRLNAGVFVRQNIGFGGEYGMEFRRIPTATKTIDNQEYDIVEGMKCRTVVIMPKILFTRNNSMSPSGLTQEIGFGLSSARIVPDTYLARKSNTNEFVELPENTFNFTTFYRSLLVSYAYRMRTPISKSLLINYGFRYNLELIHLYGVSYNATLFNEVKALKNVHLSNIISAELGLTLPL